jgi:hypothetical protein
LSSRHFDKSLYPRTISLPHTPSGNALRRYATRNPREGA